jgi:hypothetical protein
MSCQNETGIGPLASEITNGALPHGRCGRRVVRCSTSCVRSPTLMYSRILTGVGQLSCFPGLPSPFADRTGATGRHDLVARPEHLGDANLTENRQPIRQIPDSMRNLPTVVRPDTADGDAV